MKFQPKAKTANERFVFSIFNEGHPGLVSVMQLRVDFRKGAPVWPPKLALQGFGLREPGGGERSAKNHSISACQVPCKVIVRQDFEEIVLWVRRGTSQE